MEKINHDQFGGRVLVAQCMRLSGLPGTPLYKGYIGFIGLRVYIALRGDLLLTVWGLGVWGLKVWIWGLELLGGGALGLRALSPTILGTLWTPTTWYPTTIWAIVLLYLGLDG